MPRLVLSPEQILRTTLTDFYFIRFTDGLQAYRAGREPDGKAVLEEWLCQHLPDARLELIGPSEFAGILCGGIGSDYAFFVGEEGIAQFASRWEHPDGSSIDPRWQCIWYPYSEFERRLAEHGDPRARGR